MKTTEGTIKARIAHHRALKALASPTIERDGIALWRQLRKIENRAESAAVAYCNDGDSAKWESEKKAITAAVRNCLGLVPVGFFINGDPRGYALKLDPDETTIPEGMHTDWGRNGILAPVIE